MLSSSPPINPFFLFSGGVDMDDQERKKLERKRARNRAAASKCRQRKLERIQELEGQVQHERQKCSHLQTEIERVTIELQTMREHYEQHRRAGCQLNVPN
jgi:molecular chaperone GrpE (heat shock protein)